MKRASRSWCFSPGGVLLFCEFFLAPLQLVIHSEQTCFNCQALFVLLSALILGLFQRCWHICHCDGCGKHICKSCGDPYESGGGGRNGEQAIADQAHDVWESGVCIVPSKSSSCSMTKRTSPRVCKNPRDAQRAVL